MLESGALGDMEQRVSTEINKQKKKTKFLIPNELSHPNSNPDPNLISNPWCIYAANDVRLNSQKLQNL